MPTKTSGVLPMYRLQVVLALHNRAKFQHIGPRDRKALSRLAGLRGESGLPGGDL